MIKMSDQSAELHEGMLAFEKFTKTPVGERLIRLEQAKVNDLLPELFGYHLLELGVIHKQLDFSESTIKHQFSLHHQPAEGVSAYFERELLPLETSSVDLVVLHHLLDYSRRPHELLKEISRIVIPSGHLIILGFNPFSCLGFRSLLAKKFGKGLQQKFFTPHKLSDWLKLVDFKVQQVDYGFYSPAYNPLIKAALSDRLERAGERLDWPLGGFYIIKAVKHVSPLTPRPKKKRRRPSVIPLFNPSLPTRIEPRDE